MNNKDKQQDILKELDELSPGLHKILPQKRTDDLPFRYFERLPDQVLNTLKKEPVPDSNWLEQFMNVWFTKRRLILAIASIIGLILIVGILNNDQDHRINLSDLKSSEIQSYLLNHAEDLDDDQLSLLSKNDIIDKMDLLHISDEELEPVLNDYLYQIQDVELN